MPGYAGPAAWPASLVLAGAGKMGGALLRGWLAAGLDAAAVRIVDPFLDEEHVGRWRAAGVELGGPATPPQVLVLAVKPQSFAAEASAFASLVGQDTLVVSILAGKTLATLRAALPEAGGIVRAMPNLPASIGRGASAAAAEATVSPRDRALAESLLTPSGLLEWLDESMIDAVTAVSGSGPAYVFLLAECLAEAGVAAGLPQDVAARLARATVEGAGALLADEVDRSPRELREAVTSPGGTTAAALAVLRGPHAMPALLREAVAAAKRRAGDLSA